ncbi:MAG: hypothetical protein LBC29_00875, partial [Propionibacteriaceae bacterium]|nr:hypothetical protein [Propionibacteriaceae bacterium]
MPADWSSFILRFDFDTAYANAFDSVDLNELLWDGNGSYSGLIQLFNDDGTPATNAVITGVYSIDAYNYWMTLAVSATGHLDIGIPDWQVPRHTVERGVVKGSNDATRVAYFLDNSGSNYATDISAVQSLPDSTNAAGVYLAPAYTLYTNAEFSGGADVIGVYLDCVALDSAKWSTSSGGTDKPFNLDGVQQPVIANQLVLTLAADWTRENDYHTVMVAFADGTVAQGVIIVSGIDTTAPTAQVQYQTDAPRNFSNT